MKFIRRDHQTSIPENTPPGSVLLTTGVNKLDSVSQIFFSSQIFSDSFLFFLRRSESTKSIPLSLFSSLLFQNLRFWLVGAIEDLERFSITNSGELILKGTLDYERRVQHSFLVRVTDGHHVRTISSLLSFKF